MHPRVAEGALEPQLLSHDLHRREAEAVTLLILVAVVELMIKNAGIES
jgi:hypothetical protein